MAQWLLLLQALGFLTPMLTREGRFVPGTPRHGFVEGTGGPLPKQDDVVVMVVRVF